MHLLCRQHCQVFNWQHQLCSHTPPAGTQNPENEGKAESSLQWFWGFMPCPVLTTLCSRRSSRSDTELLNWDAKEHICWQRLRRSNRAASRFSASAVLVRRLSKWMILLQRKVTWKSKPQWEKLFHFNCLIDKHCFFHVLWSEDFKHTETALLQ